MAEQATCGQGLAAGSTVPAKMAQYLASLAENLEAHMDALVLQDPAASAEHNAYASLLDKFKEISSDLRSAADEMASYRDLPMGDHDMEVLSGPRVMEAFEGYVLIERDLLDLIAATHSENEEMLREAKSESDS